VPPQSSSSSSSSSIPLDLTSHVGIVRREWEVRKGWDSRHYYPATPLYVCDRAWTYRPEFALKAPDVPDGMRLVAFVARPSGRDSDWGALVDTLNPAATRLFIELTHERYAAAVGDMFGREIQAIFTDEPKYFGGHPWTPDLFGGFAAQFGYDLRGRLPDLFGGDSERAMLTRLHYREWCGERFRDAWLRPVAAWCRAHGLALVGHISPEDDPGEQVACVSDLFPLMAEFDLAGLDLIIPAVGDARHPLINIGVVSAASVAQQRERPGVMCEMLACSGLDFTAASSAGVRVMRYSDGPRLVQAQTGLVAIEPPFPTLAFGELPRAADVAGRGATDVRATAWQKGGATRLFLINIGERDCDVRVNGKPTALPVGVIRESA